jgi:hypothetical protein
VKKYIWIIVAPVFYGGIGSDRIVVAPAQGHIHQGEETCKNLQQLVSVRQSSGGRLWSARFPR